MNASDCIPWRGRIHPNGYGMTDDPATGMPAYAHRKAYEATHGPIPDGMQIDHTCHNTDPTCPGGAECLHRRCVNPAHLEAVTIAENLRRSPNFGANRTQCPRGHEYTDANTERWTDPDGYQHRKCRECKNARRRVGARQ